MARQGSGATKKGTKAAATAHARIRDGPVAEGGRQQDRRTKPTIISTESWIPHTYIIRATPMKTYNHPTPYDFILPCIKTPSGTLDAAEQAEDAAFFVRLVA